MTATIAPTAKQLLNVVKVFTKTNYDAIISDAAAYFQCQIEDVALVQIKNPANRVLVQIGIRQSPVYMKVYGVVKYQPCWLGHNGYIFTNSFDDTLIQPLPYVAPATSEPDQLEATPERVPAMIEPCNTFYHSVAMQYALIFRTNYDLHLDEIKRRYHRLINSETFFSGSAACWRARKAAYETLIDMKTNPDAFKGNDFVVVVGA